MSESITADEAWQRKVADLEGSLKDERAGNKTLMARLDQVERELRVLQNMESKITRELLVTVRRIMEKDWSRCD